MKKSVKTLLRELLTHSAAFSGGMLFQKLRESSCASELEKAASGLEPNDLEELRQGFVILRDFLISLQPLAEAMAIFFGVIFKAARALPGLEQDLGGLLGGQE